MATYFPTKKGTDASPQTGQPPASNTLGGIDALSEGAQQIINDNQDLIGGFLHAQRQNVANSIKDYHRASYTSPDIDIHYTNQSGAERIDLHPHPQSPIETAAAEAEVTPTTIEEEIVQAIELAPPTNPTLYLMVLFKQDGIAAFQMSGLSAAGPGQADFVGTSSGSMWVDAPGKILTVGQYSLVGTEWILTQIDLSGQTQAKRLMLSTTALTDAVATQADIQSMPVMNTNVAKGVYTVGGGFGIDIHGAITETIDMVSDGGLVVAPTGIAVDGTSYFFPTVLGADISVQLDQKSVIGYPSSSSFLNQVNTDQEPLVTSLPNPDVFCVLLQDTTTVTSDHYNHQDFNNKIFVCTVGTEVAGSFVDGQSYWGKAGFGQVPVPQNVKLAQSPTEAELFDISVNHTTIQTTPAGSSDFGNTFWLQTYTYTGGNDVVDVETFPVSGTGTTTQPVTANTDKDTFHSLLFGGVPGCHATSIVDGTLDGVFSQTEDQNVVSSPTIPGVTYPPNPGTGGDVSPDNAAVVSFYETLKALAQGAPHLIGQREYTSTQLDTLQDTRGMTPIYSASGDFATTDEAPFPAGCAATIIVVGGTTVAEAATDLHFPYGTGSTTGTLTRTSEVEAFGQTLSYTYIRSTGFTTTQLPPSMVVHAHPPVFKTGTAQAKPWTTVTRPGAGIGGTDTHTISTPYGQFSGATAESFTPWLHVSNGKHVIQGFYVDGTPHAFVDGSSQAGFLTKIATACNCLESEIVAMYMDVTLAKVQAVANVQPPSYSQSHGGAPGVP